MGRTIIPLQKKKREGERGRGRESVCQSLSQRVRECMCMCARTLHVYVSVCVQILINQNLTSIIYFLYMGFYFYIKDLDDDFYLRVLFVRLRTRRKVILHDVTGTCHSPSIFVYIWENSKRELLYLDCLDRITCETSVISIGVWLLIKGHNHFVYICMKNCSFTSEQFLYRNNSLNIKQGSSFYKGTGFVEFFIISLQGNSDQWKQVKTIY